MKAKFIITPYPGKDSMLVKFIFTLDSFELEANTDRSKESVFKYCKQKLLDMDMEMEDYK